MARVSGSRIWAAGARPGLRVHDHLPAELADHRAHGVHPHPAARDVARDLRGGEARGEEQLDGALRVDPVDRVGPDEPALDRDRGDLRRVDAPAVVGDLDEDVRAGVAGGDRQDAERVLARRFTLLRRLEPVVERVAHEVDERVAERVDDRAVELRVGPHQLEVDLLGELRGEVAHEAREAEEDRLDGDHADLHDHGLQRLGGAGHLLHRVLEARDVRLRGERLEVRAVDHELAHGVHELVQALRVDADAGGAAGGRGARRGGRGLPEQGIPGGLVGVGLGGRGLRRTQVHPGDVGDAGGGGGDDLVLVVRGQPGLDGDAREGVDVLERGGAAEQLPVVAERGEHHERAHGGHGDVVVEAHADLHDAHAPRPARPGPSGSSRRAGARARAAAPPGSGRRGARSAHPGRCPRHPSRRWSPRRPRACRGTRAGRRWPRD